VDEQPRALDHVEKLAVGRNGHVVLERGEPRLPHSRLQVPDGGPEIVADDVESRAIRRDGV
jgi:hypothetical protein